MSDAPPGTPIVVQGIRLAMQTQLCALDNQGDVEKLLRLQGKHGEAAVVRDYDPEAFQELARRARLSLATARTKKPSRR